MRARGRARAHACSCICMIDVDVDAAEIDRCNSSCNWLSLLYNNIYYIIEWYAVGQVMGRTFYLYSILYSTIGVSLVDLLLLGYLLGFQISHVVWFPLTVFYVTYYWTSLYLCTCEFFEILFIESVRFSFSCLLYFVPSSYLQMSINTPDQHRFMIIIYLWRNKSQ